LTERRDSQEERGVPTFLLCVQLGEFLLGCGKADGKSFNFAEPALALGFGDPGEEVLADLFQVLSGQRMPGNSALSPFGEARMQHPRLKYDADLLCTCVSPLDGGHESGRR